MKEAGGAEVAARMLADHGMQVPGFCVGGLLTASDNAGFHDRLGDNRRIIEEASTISARTTIFVAGGLPEGSKDIARARAQILGGGWQNSCQKQRTPASNSRSSRCIP